MGTFNLRSSTELTKFNLNFNWTLFSAKVVIEMNELLNLIQLVIFLILICQTAGETFPRIPNLLKAKSNFPSVIKQAWRVSKGISVNSVKKCGLRHEQNSSLSTCIAQSALSSSFWLFLIKCMHVQEHFRATLRSCLKASHFDFIL